MKAPAQKKKYCRCLYLEPGMVVVTINSFLSLGVALIAMPRAMPFGIIYLVHCIAFTALAFANEKIYTRIGFLLFYVLSTIAEIVVGVWLTLGIRKEYHDALDGEDVSTFNNNLIMLTIPCAIVWLAFRILALVTIYTFLEDLRDGGARSGQNLHTDMKSNSDLQDKNIHSLNRD